jgi:hypothetical protein
VLDPDRVMVGGGVVPLVTSMVPSASPELDASKVQVRSVHWWVKDAVGAWLTGGGGSVPPPGLNSVMLLTSSRGSLIPSPESSVQSRLPAPVTAVSRARTSVTLPGLAELASSGDVQLRQDV